ncbi:hypothetical protein W01_20160 [Candidatus Nitrotoga sp. AM1P]|nr:hypothetical protein W01_20160 [Candidatus Nitrotoga sp. AM1P]
MARLRFFDGVDGQCTNSVDAKLVELNVVDHDLLPIPCPSQNLVQCAKCPTLSDRLALDKVLFALLHKAMFKHA